MSQFVQLSDYDASIHREILDALTRADESVIEICEDRAIAEMRCYLSKRYDCDRIFAATGADRLQLVLMMVIDIAVYHIFCIHNPQKLSQLRKDRYDRAVEWMKAVAAEDISIQGGTAPARGGACSTCAIPLEKQHQTDQSLVTDN